LLRRSLSYEKIVQTVRDAKQFALLFLTSGSLFSRQAWPWMVGSFCETCCFGFQKLLFQRLKPIVSRRKTTGFARSCLSVWLPMGCVPCCGMVPAVVGGLWKREKQMPVFFTKTGILSN